MNKEEIAKGILSGSIKHLSKAITLIESNRPEDIDDSKIILNRLISHAGHSLRIGISGPPGVGKSTFIDNFGSLIISKGLKVAVLSIDPSSQISKGSILGDKTRMSTLSVENNAFIRPSPSGETLGGVASKTRESILLCEAAGYNVIIVETIGVGQSETAVCSMVDVFVLLQIPNSGDELQGIKKGVLEVADIIVVNKADGENKKAAELSKAQLENAIHMLRPIHNNWKPPVLLCSAIENKGIKDIWETICNYKKIMLETSEFMYNRRNQNVSWMWDIILDNLKNMFKNSSAIKNVLPATEKKVFENKLHSRAAAEDLIAIFKNGINS